MFVVGNLMMLLWYCYDDHLALWLHAPELGHVPFIVWISMGTIQIGGDIIQGMLMELYDQTRQLLRHLRDSQPRPGVSA